MFRILVSTLLIAFDGFLGFVVGIFEQGGDVEDAHKSSALR